MTTRIELQGAVPFELALSFDGLSSTNSVPYHLARIIHRWHIVIAPFPPDIDTALRVVIYRDGMALVTRPLFRVARKKDWSSDFEERLLRLEAAMRYDLRSAEDSRETFDVFESSTVRVHIDAPTWVGSARVPTWIDDASLVLILTGTEGERKRARQYVPVYGEDDS